MAMTKEAVAVATETVAAAMAQQNKKYN